MRNFASVHAPLRTRLLFKPWVIFYHYREENHEEEFEQDGGLDELDASVLHESLEQHPEPSSPQQESATSSPEQQLSTSPEQKPVTSAEQQPARVQANKTKRSVMTQTEEIKKAKPSVPKYVPAYGPHQKFTRRYEALPSGTWTH